MADQFSYVEQKIEELERFVDTGQGEAARAAWPKAEAAMHDLVTATHVPGQDENPRVRDLHRRLHEAGQDLNVQQPKRPRR